MRPTLPLLLMTVLQGLSGGLMISFGVLWWLVPSALPTLDILLWSAFLIAAIGGVASLFHMHKPKAGRYILRRLRTSWLSREALTTGIYVPALGVLVILPHLVPKIPLEYYGLGIVFTGVLGLVAMYVTAMLYATIPAMRSWHTRLTVIAMMLVGIVSGMAVAEGILAVAHVPGAGGRDFHIALLVGIAVLAGIKWMQYRHFLEARQSLRTATGTGMPAAPYRLIDSGTTKLPYRTQTQVGPELAPRRRQMLYVMMGLTLIVVPMALQIFPLQPAELGIRWTSAAIVMVCGAFVERWLFFADVTHSSRVWFGDELKRASSVSSNRVSPDFVRRFRHQDGL